MKTIYLNESQLELISEKKNEYTYYEFTEDMKNILKQLVSTPTKISVPNNFSEYGVSSGKNDIIDNMLDMGLITSSERIDEIPDSNGKKTSKQYIKYIVHRDNFDDKMMKLYKKMIKNTNSVIEEEGEGGGMSCGFAMQGGGTNPSAGQYDAPITAGPIDRKFWKPALKRGKNKSISINKKN